MLGDGLAPDAGADADEGVGLSGSASDVDGAVPADAGADVTPDPGGVVVVEVWLLVEQAPTSAATSPVKATTRHTRAVVDR